MKKRILSALLATIMLFGMMPMVTYAQAEEMPMLTTTYVNPVYDSVLSPEEISIDVSSPAMLSAPVYHTDPSTTAAEMRAALESRAAEVTIGYQIPKNSFNEETLGEITDGIFEAAYAHTGVPTQGDYLRWHFAYCGISAMSSGTNLDGTIWYTDLTFHLEYYTTQEQEEVVAARVDSLLAELNPTGTDYEKIKTVYDWMCENIVYDYANLNDPTYDLKYSAYAALINGTSVCQGYSNLLYRMALEMGIDCRIITGWGNGGNHAWNIIKLGNSYYNLDATWDSTFAQAGRKNQFFLRSEANFGDHVRSPECDTAAFHAAYPMGKTDYDPKQNVVEDESIIASGTCDEFLTWTLDENGTLTISGEGLMEDFGRQDTAPWHEHREAIKKVVIKDGVTSIGSLAFLECVNLAEIEIADTVTDIELGAFWDCDSLVSIVIPNSVTAMEDCFHTKLQSITLSNNLTKIDQGMFANCTELTSIVIPEGVTSLEKGAFFGCENLESIILPSTLTKIGHEVFYGCTSLEMVAIPEKVTEIDGDAFQNTGLTSIEIPASVTTIWEGAFRECEKLTGIWVDKDNTVYSSDASGALLDKEQKTLLQVPGGLTGKYEIPDGVTSIEGWALSFCAKLTEVTIPDSVDTIGDGAFYGCAELKSVIVPAGISMIDEAVFSGCTNLTAVVIPDTVAEIREWAFDECDRLWHVLFNGTEDQWNSIAIAKNNTALKKATCHYNAKGDEVIAVNKTTCTEKIFCECTICGAVLAETISGGAHTWDNGVVTKEPTEETVGVRTYTCVTCGETKTEEIPALEHTHVFVTVVTAPTCTEGGYTTHTCACGEEVLTDVTNPLGHKLAYTVQTQPTVEADGILAGSCERCDHKTEEVLPKLNKTEYTYEVTKQPTTGETGIGRYTWATEYGTFFFEVTLDKLPEQPEVAFGDTDGNGRIQTNDAKLILQHIVRMPVELNLDAADVDGNGKIQTNDAKLILQYIVKIITQFPAQNQ